MFGAKSSPSCANFLLMKTGGDNKEAHPEVAQSIERNFYMDDFANSMKPERKAILVCKELLETL